jgi:hypothetical protein
MGLSELHAPVSHSPYTRTRVYMFVAMCMETVTGARHHVILKELGWKRKPTGKPKDRIKNNSGFIYFITVPLLTTSCSGMACHWYESHPPFNLLSDSSLESLKLSINSIHDTC